MYQDTVECLKRKIKMAYERYTGERTDGKATLLDVAKFFNIPIDDSRIEDYVVKKIDYNNPSIEIIDEKNNTTYTAIYTGNADLLKCWSPKKWFNSVVSISPISKLESLYYIESANPIITKMTFTNGDYELVFVKEMPHNIGSLGNDAVKMAVSYLQNVVYSGKSVKQHLLNKIYNNHYKDGELDYSFEQLYTYGGNRYINYKDTESKYTYIRNNSVVYGIDEYKQKGSINYLVGICFENTNVQVGDLPFGIEEKNYPLLNDDSVKSAMIFRSMTEGCLSHSLQIYKGNDAISVMYHASTECYEYYEEGGGYYTRTIAHEEYSLPNLSSETISKEEIQNVLSSLKERLGDRISIDILSNELNTFATKIDIRKGLVQEEVEPLPPKLLIDKSFEEICALVSANKDDYFKLISEQFEAATNHSIEKGQSKVLKSNNVKK